MQNAINERRMHCGRHQVPKAGLPGCQDTGLPGHPGYPRVPLENIGTCARGARTI